MPLPILFLVIVTTTGVSANVGCWLKKRGGLRAYASATCEQLSERPAIESDVSRDAFTMTSLHQAPLVPGHTHATAAALRSGATKFAEDISRHTGGDLYVVGMSKSDQRKGLRGSRQWYWSKDVNTDNRADVPGDSDVQFFCDVDYYLDMPAILARGDKPVLLYTVVPEEAVSTGEDDTSFLFTESGSLKTFVAGGGSYEHYLWNYASDSLLARQEVFGITIRAVSYAVERKQVSRHRQVILLTPMRIFRGISAWLAGMLLEHQPLERFNPIVKFKEGDKFVRFNIQAPSGEMLVTTARPDQWLCATVSAEKDACVATAARLGTQKIQIPTTASWLADKRAPAAILTDYYRFATGPTTLTVYPVAKGVRAYQYKPQQYDQEAKPKLEAFMSPLIHGAFAPVLNKAGEEQCVEGRINSLRRAEPKQSTFRDKCITEFANLVVGDTVLEPVCMDVVQEKQTSATQKTSLARASVMGDARKRILKCFGKAEAYPDIKDPRNISMYNDGDKLDMACFALSLSEHCKQYDWYGPGKTPIEIANRVSEICSGASFANISDYHRMDGTITYTLRQVERAICMKAFANHRTKLNELLKTNVDNIGTLPNGTTFEQGPSHGSGCSATSLFQTLRAAFTAYLAFRHTRRNNGRTYTPKEAFLALGIHLGDDGLDADLPVNSHNWAAERVGLVLEAHTVDRGDRGVNFLARYYSPNVWFGDNNSMCDVRRQLSKFHTTVRLPENVSPEKKAVEKSMSYLATDANTPVLGEFCARVLVLSKYRPRVPLGIGSWWSKFDSSVQYPNTNVGGWMDVEFDCLLPKFDRHQFNVWLDTATTVAKLLSPPICCETPDPTPTSVEVVVDETTILSPRVSTQSTSSVKVSENGKENEKQEDTRKRPSRTRGKKVQKLPAGSKPDRKRNSGN